MLLMKATLNIVDLFNAKPEAVFGMATFDNPTQIIAVK